PATQSGPRVDSSRPATRPLSSETLRISRPRAARGPDCGMACTRSVAARLAAGGIDRTIVCRSRDWSRAAPFGRPAAVLARAGKKRRQFALIPGTPSRQRGGTCSARHTEIPDLFSLIQAAGWPIWFLIIASIAAVALIVERSISLRRDRV